MQEDIIKFGFIPEFIGRIPIITTLHSLNIDCLVDILTKPENSIVKQYQKIFKLDNIDLQFDKKALYRIAELAIERNMGARGIKTIIENSIIDLMYKLPSSNKTKYKVSYKDII
jgi:ATP-dependent Clp protease ATP-binding subunit ClpX